MAISSMGMRLREYSRMIKFVSSSAVVRDPQGISLSGWTSLDTCGCWQMDGQVLAVTGFFRSILRRGGRRSNIRFFLCHCWLGMCNTARRTVPVDNRL